MLLALFAMVLFVTLTIISSASAMVTTGSEDTTQLSSNKNVTSDTKSPAPDVFTVNFEKLQNALKTVMKTAEAKIAAESCAIESDVPESNVPESVYVSLDVPMDYESNTGFKAYMDYRTITSPSSKQYALQQEAYTDPDTGIRMYDGCYMVALGTFYAQQAGERFHITLTSGVEFDAITGDIKADIHTDTMHQHRNGNIVEFVVDTRCISRTCKVMGDMSWAGFKGQVAKIEKLSAST